MTRMVVIPNSWGSFEEGNPCHLPAGRSDGGQFCSTISGSGKIFLEPPKAKTPGKKGVELDIEFELFGSEKALKRELGISNPYELARKMVAGVEDESFTVKAKIGGGDPEAYWEDAMEDFVGKVRSFLDDSRLDRIYQRVLENRGVSSVGRKAGSMEAGKLLLDGIVDEVLDAAGVPTMGWDAIGRWIERRVNRLVDEGYHLPDTLRGGFAFSDVSDRFPTYSEWFSQHGEEVSRDPSLFLEFRGDKGTLIKRRFFVDEESGDLAVYHQFFEVDPNRQGEGLARQVFQSSLKAYDEIGVASIQTSANIDVGSYAWARYGFVPEDSYILATNVRHRLQGLVSKGVVTINEAEQIGKLIQPDRPEFVWDIADARIATTMDRAAQVREWFKNRSSEIYKSKVLQREVDDGIINIGRMLLADITWAAKLDLRNKRYRERLMSYLGG